MAAIDGSQAARTRAFEIYASEVVAKQPPAPAGIAVSAAAGGGVAGEWGFGSRDAEAGLPVTADTVFGIASVAKPFTALAVVLLEELGALDVTDPVSKWLPEFRLPSVTAANASDSPTVTLHHLLTHTSGLPPEVALPYARAGDMLRDPDLARLVLSDGWRSFLAEVEDREEVVTSYAELLDRLARAQFAPLAPPGRLFSYSGEGYALLAAVVERASGGAFADFVHERVLDPLELTGTGFRPGTFDSLARTHPVAQLYTTGYATAAREGETAPFASPAWWASGGIFGHGNMVSTARDLVRFAELLRQKGTARGRRIAAPSTIEKMLTPHAPIPTGGFYGYGLSVHPGHHGDTLVEHAGGGKGCAATLAFVLEAGVSAAALANGPTGAAHRLAMGALHALAGLPPDAPVPPLPDHALEAGALARFAGTYRWNELHEGVSFELRDDTLYAVLGGRTHACRPFAADGVVVSGPELPVRFLLNDGGRAWALSDGARVSRRVGEDRAAR